MKEISRLPVKDSPGYEVVKYELDASRPWEQRNLNEMFGPQTHVSYVEKIGHRNNSAA